MSEGFINELRIIDPPEKSFEFIMGESRTLRYKIHNSGEMPIKDFDVSAKTVLRTGEDSDGKPLYVPTRKNYARIDKYPKTLMPGQKKDIDVHVVVPFDYDERIMRGDKETIWPFRIALVVKSIKHIKEI